MITPSQIEQVEYEAMYLLHYGVMEIMPAKPNPMFSPLQNFITKFVRPGGKEQWTCAACGCKRGRKWFWTQLVPFRASDLDPHQFTLRFGPVLEALTPVCAEHVLSPEI